MIRKIMNMIGNGNKVKALKANNSIKLHDKIFNGLLSNNAKLSDIPDAFQLLLSSDEKIKLQAAEVLNLVIGTLSSNHLVKVDKIFRERTSIDWNYNWRNEDPKKLLHPSMSEEEKVAILGLSSFHPNGYFREKAILALSNNKTDCTIPYLLIRLNDWVSQVRRSAKEQLLRYLTEERATGFVNNLPLVLRLKECSRDKHNDIIDLVLSIISSEEGSQSLINGLQSTDSKVRLACYKIILKKKVLNNRSIIKYLIKDTNPYNRLSVLRNMTQEIAEDEFLDISQLLLQDKSAQIRVFNLELLYSFVTKESVAILEKSLFDNNQSVRDLARYLLSKHKEYDFASMYRYEIRKNERLYPSICGLGETGNINDSEFVIKFINSDVVKIVKASINALARLDIQEYKEKIILFLNDERTGISKTARRVLSKEINDGDTDAIYRIFRKATVCHVKINTGILLCSLSKWNAIRYIIELCADKNEDISMLGQSTLERWKLKYNNSFTTPTNNQIEEIERSLIYFGDAVKDSDKNFIKFCIADFSM